MVGKADSNDSLEWVIESARTVSEALDLIGIFEPARTGILNCPEVTLEMVMTVWRETQLAGGGTGAFCYRIKQHIFTAHKRQEAASRIAKSAEGAS